METWLVDLILAAVVAAVFLSALIRFKTIRPRRWYWKRTRKGVFFYNRIGAACRVCTPLCQARRRSVL